MLSKQKMYIRNKWIYHTPLLNLDKCVDNAMDEYAKEIAIDFANWIKNNHYSKDNDERWYKYKETREDFPQGFSMLSLATEFFTSEQLFELYKKENNIQ